MTSSRTRDRLIGRLMHAGIKDPRVLDALRQTPRHLFVDEALASRAYEDIALPIGHGQTISQPFIVALMSQSLVEGVNGPGTILEIGTGCGYQTAILSQLFSSVFTVERINDLHRKAQKRLYKLGYRNIFYRYGDGLLGWPENALYDGILMAAAPERIPHQLLDQLAPGGRLVAPIGAKGRQVLVLLEKREDKIEERTIEYVSFVPALSGTQ